MKTLLSALLPYSLPGLFLAVLLLSLVGCGPEGNASSQASTEEAPPAKPEKGLKDYFQDQFTMGASVGPRVLQGAEAELIVREFGSLTAENVMKIGPIHPEEDRYDWEAADQVAAFAREHNLKLRGHTLCWHNQTPDWLFVDEAGKRVDKEVLLARLKQHITDVVTRYKGTIYAWDVVNEAVTDGGEAFYRSSPWYEICGEEYIAKAFEYAHAADPDALLFYNDYNATKPEKRDKIVRLIQQLQANGVPIHGIGVQGHWSIYGPDEEELRAALDQYAALGLDIQITELDVSVYPPEGDRRAKRPDEPDAFTPEMESKQIEQYRMIFDVFRDYQETITGVTFWNVTDRRSWLDNFPVRGRKNYPLLFDTTLQRKRAYWAAVGEPLRD